MTVTDVPRKLVAIHVEWQSLFLSEIISVTLIEIDDIICISLNENKETIKLLTLQVSKIKVDQ